ncbi:MAG: electron transfer flavoprotein subunit alpha/FixB family protein [Candidatus Kapaibacterium sp.]
MKIAVFIETHNAQGIRSAKEALTAARSLNAEIVGITTSSADALHQFAEYGLTTCITVSHDLLATYSSTAIASAVAQAAKSANANVVMFGGNASGKEIAPRVAVKLQAGYIPDVVEVQDANGALQCVRPVFAGKAREHVKATTTVTVVTLRPNVFTAKAVGGGAVTTSAFTPELTGNDAKVKTTGVTRNEGKLDVLEADIIVSGGRGMKGPEHFTLVEDLAKPLGAAVGASRAVVDAGWRPHGDQVGQTGKTVSPSLYVACGISGAVQHLAGMSSSKVIVAINKDKEAPIFKVADYGIIGDVFEVLPKLTAKIKEVTGK